MTIGTTRALDLIQGALRKVNSYQSGETIATPDASDCLDVLNDLLDSLSTRENFVMGVNENILYWTAGKHQYTVGNPTCTLLSSQPFIGTITSGSPTITGVTNMPANLVAGSTVAYAVGSGSILNDVQGLIPLNTTVLAFSSGAQTVTMSANAIGNSVGTDSVTYTVPGDFPIPRPLRITSGFTRFNALDFTLDVAQTQQQYNEILYKAQPGPWPTVSWYDYTFPYGVMNVYQTPGNGAELHLFTQTILANMTLTQILVMPHGYARALKLLLAREIWTEFMGGSPFPPLLATLVQEASDYIEALNSRPQQVARYDRALARGSRPDGGWIIRGGY
jgi:hypothetical protein